VQGLYAICDLDFASKRSLDPLRYARALLAARPAALQIRAKHAPVGTTLELLRALRSECAEQGTLLFANDRPDLAVLAGCDGVHVGQSDLPVSEVRRFDRQLRIGVSTHSLPQLETALRAAPSYVAFGPVFATDSKENADAAQGIPRLLEAAELARAAGIPIVAIGGIRVQHLPELVGRVTAVALISGLCPAANERSGAGQPWHDITARAAAIQAAFVGPY
jgi:thiamine-phosphate pyrophosphorylase